MDYKILYRGKISGTKEWATGTPFIFGDRCKMIHAVAVHPDFVDDGNVYYSEGFPVDIETVGQYTGCHDSTKWEELSASEQEDFIRKGGKPSEWNGKQIFVGDIVKYTDYDDFTCCSIVKFGEYFQDGSSGEYGPRKCIGLYVEVDSFVLPDWWDDYDDDDDDDEHDYWYHFRHYNRQQSLLEAFAECKIIGNIHDTPGLLRSK